MGPAHFLEKIDFAPAQSFALSIFVGATAGATFQLNGVSSVWVLLFYGGAGVVWLFGSFSPLFREYPPGNEVGYVTHITRPLWSRYSEAVGAGILLGGILFDILIVTSTRR